MKKMNKFWNITQVKGATKIDLFGVLSEEGWDGNISSKDFLQQFRAIEPTQKLEITINSPGGSVSTGLSIYELVKAHKGAVEIHVAGIACSAATIITSAPNARVTVSDGSLLMIHRVSTMVSGNPEDLKKEAEAAEKIEEVIANIYAIKTGKSKAEILEKMKAETYFTAEEAVEYGLADILDSASKVTNSLEGGVLLVNGLKIDSEIVKSLPKTFVGVEACASTFNENPKKESSMDLEKLKAEYPDLVEAIAAQARQEGANAERARIQEIEAIALPGFENLVTAAKADGKTTAADLSVRIVKAQMAHKQTFAKERDEDAKGLEGIKAMTVDPMAESEAEKSLIEAARKSFVNK